MNQQCNSCGGFHNPQPCQACNTLVCENCRANHTYVCKQAQALKRRGAGPTVAASKEMPMAHSVGVALGVDFNIPPDGPVAPPPNPPEMFGSGLLDSEIQTGEQNDESTTEGLPGQEQTAQQPSDDQGSGVNSGGSAGDVAIDDQPGTSGGSDPVGFGDNPESSTE